MENINDWFVDFKLKILSLVSLLQQLKEDMIIMLTMSEWVLEEESLDESFENLKEMLTGSNQDLELLIGQIGLIEQENIFDLADLDNEFDFVHDTIHLELDYMNYIADYLCQFNQIAVSKKRIKEKFLNQEKRYLEQIERNKQQLKQLRKERRKNYFE